jgi:ABC-type nitrate/sulfonate/bicarbonate transport system substrate-binding protein
MSLIASGRIASAVLALLLMLAPAGAQEPLKLKMGRLGFPSLSSILVDVAKAQKFDQKNGLDMEVSSYGAVSAYYAALATGEVDMLAGGPHVFQKMILEGVPIRIAITWARLNALGVIAGDPAVKSIADLKGKSIAADMGSSEYQVLAIYGRTQGLVFGKDVTVVQAGPPLARTQLQASRVEAAMMWEPTTTLTLRDNPQHRLILRGDVAWKAIANAPGWELVAAMRDDFLKRSPAAVPRVLKTLQDAQNFIRQKSDEADEVVVGTLKLPKGVVKDGVVSDRIVFEVLPAWEGERAAIEAMFKIAVDTGYLPKLPGDGAIYKP